MLVLGGTRFVGRAVVDAALADGWSVSTFNRGLSGPDVAGVSAIRGDRSSHEDVLRAAAAGPFDAVVDLGGYVPREVFDVATALEPATHRYISISTVSVYEGWPAEPLSEASAVLDCPYDAGPGFGPDDVEDGPTRYGRLKAGTERAVRRVFGKDRSCVLRLGVVLGPGEYVGRLPWWLRRINAGGRVVAPGDPGRGMQPVDVRDAADFAVRAAAAGMTGFFNVAAPIGHYTFGEFLSACRVVTGSAAEFVWIDDTRLVRAGVRQWSELPLWRTHAGVWQVDPTAAIRAGLRYRPIGDTVSATWDWMRGTNLAASERSAEIGLTAEHEKLLLT